MLNVFYSVIKDWIIIPQNILVGISIHFDAHIKPILVKVAYN